MVESLWRNPKELTSKGFKPKRQTLENEASAALKSYFTENDVEFQPPPCTVTDAMQRIAPSELLKNILSQALHQWTHISPYSCGIAYFRNTKLR
jgi:hypothetical protein